MVVSRSARDSMARPTLLVVEDDDAIRELLVTAFEGGYRLLSARDGTEAFRVLAGAEPQVVILDLGLPDIDGREILRRLTSATARLPVIVITGQQEPRAAVECMKLGALDYFTKPFTLDEITASVEKAARLGRLEARETLILLVGGDRGEAATIGVLLESRVPLNTVATARAALKLVVPPCPSLVVLLEPLDAAERRILLDTLRREHPTVDLLIVTADVEGLATWQTDLLRIVGIVRMPCRLHELVSRIMWAARATVPAFPIPVVQAAEYVSRHYRQRCLLGDAAAYAEVSASHLAHLFRYKVGMTWRQFVGRTRVELAKECLADPRCTLETVAELVGFCDAAHLSRMFRRRVKQSPGRFRHTQAAVA
jgi:CheY-like chemotaxis protein/AraC-like DNA-binding protein